MSQLITISEYTELVNEQIVGVLPTEYADNILTAVSEDIEIWCGREFGSSAHANEKVEAQAVTYNRQPCLRVSVKHTPVTAVSALSIWYAVSADPTDLDVDDAMIEAGGASILIPFGAFGLWQTFFNIGNTYRGKITYTGGETVPTNVKRAVALLAQEAFSLDAGASYEEVDDYESFKIGDYAEKKAARDLSASDGLGLGTQNSVLAAQSLGRYRRTGVTFL